jgi:hypothetical protein
VVFRSQPLKTLSFPCYLWSLPYVPQFIGPECELEVSLDAQSKSALVAKVTSNDFPPDLFDSVVVTVEKELAGDVLPRFVKSAAWRALLAAAGSVKQAAVPPTLPPPLVTAPTPSPPPVPASSASTAHSLPAVADPASSPSPASVGGSRNSPRTSSPSLFARPRLVSVDKPLCVTWGLLAVVHVVLQL